MKRTRPKSSSKREVLETASQRLLEVLTTQRQSTEDFLTLAQLGQRLELTLPRLWPVLNSAEMRKKALVVGQKGQKGRAYLPKPKSLVLLNEDLPLLAQNPRLLQLALEFARTAKTHAFTLTQLKNNLRGDTLKKAFSAGIKQQLDQIGPPAGIGILSLRGQQYFLLLEDLLCAQNSLQAKPAVSTKAKSTSAADFAHTFAQMFEQLDAQTGQLNFVKLYDLRQALGQFTADEFNQGLRQLRLVGRYSLDSAEGTHDHLTDAERKAGIHEAGALLVYCSKK